MNCDMEKTALLDSAGQLRLQGGDKKTGTIFVHLVTSRTIHQFSKFFHCQKWEKM